ncbi:rod shape-determining protein [uncultured Serinicoccus sp.]|uniref:rod shape-determining protein n=1 Tax=uncultured Serinicoccus sp. TaxID=735514 RepID=UPI002619829E|nr:rod shape-determining protein [uncultured Serinicoccus sp.]
MSTARVPRGSTLLGRDLAIDLGTATTQVHVQGRGVVLDEPTLVALDTATGRLVAAGAKAHEMLGRTPERVLTLRPLSDGVITDSEVTEQLLRHFVERVRPTRLFRPRTVVCVPSGVTAVERRALEDAAMRCGARRVLVVEEAMAAAIGAGLPVDSAAASMVVDLGGGTTDVAVISLGGVVNARSLRVGGDEVDEAVAQGVREAYDLLLGERSAEQIKHQVGAVWPLATERTTRVRGRDLGSGLPRTIELDSEEVRRMIEPVTAQVVEAVRAVLDVCPPELSGDLLDTGVTLTGGGALLRGWTERLRHELGVPVRLADHPQHAVIRGAGVCVDDMKALRQVLTRQPAFQG